MGGGLAERNSISWSTRAGVISNGPATIRQNTIEHSTVGVLVFEGGTATVESNVITENLVAILVDGAGSRPTIRGNEFCANMSDLAVADGATPIVEANESCP